MAQGIGGFVKQNAAIGGALGVGLGAAQIAGSESKLKGIASVLATILTFKAGLAAMFVGTFSKAKDAMSNLIKESGSLEAALRRIGKAAEDAGTAYAKAKDKMKAGAGAAWAESEITNTKNMTRAVEAMTPAVTAASNSWAKITGGLGTAKSELAKAAAESGVLGSAIGFLSKAGQVLAVTLTAISVKPLVGFLFGLGGAAKVSAAALGSMSGASMRSSAILNGLSRATGISRAAFASWGSTALRAVGIIAKLSGIGVVISVLAAVAGAVYSYIKRMDESVAAAERISRASLEASRANNALIASMVTAEDKAGALASTLDELTSSYKKYLDMIGSGKKAGDIEFDAAERAYKLAQANATKAGNTGPLQGAGSGTESALHSAVVSNALKKQGLEEEMASASPERKAEMLRAVSAKASERAAGGEAEIAGKSKTDIGLAQVNADEQEALRMKAAGIAAQDEEIKKLEGRQVSGTYAEPFKRTDKPENHEGGDLNKPMLLTEKETNDRLKTLRDQKEKGTGGYDASIYEGRRRALYKDSGSKAYNALGELGDLNSKGDRGANYQKEKESLAIKQQEADTLREQAAEQAKIAQAAAEAARILEIQNTESESILKTEEALVAAKNEGYLQSHGELTARWEILNAQLKTEESMGRGNSMAARRIRVEMDKTVQGTKVLNRAIAVDVAESESARKKSLIKGDGYEVDRQKQELDLEALKAKETEAYKGTDELAKQRARTAVREQENQMENSQRAHEADVRGTEASAATSAITGAGYGVDRQKAGIERDRLVKDKAAAIGDTAKARVQASIDAHDAGEREAGVAGLQEGRGIRSELEQSSARVRGDSAALTAGSNFDEFKSKMDSLRGDVGTQKAAEIAGNLSRDAITLRARSDMNSSNAGVASASMARIGGGGGIGPGATSMIDISKQIKDLSIEANKYLFQMLELEKKKGGIPAR